MLWLLVYVYGGIMRLVYLTKNKKMEINQIYLLIYRYVMSIQQRAKDMVVEDLVRENRKLKEENKELEDELWVRKHSYKKLMKDKELYERARDVMFWAEKEDLYEDL